MDKKFEARIKYIAINEEGKEEKRNDKVLVEGLLFSEIEEKISKWAFSNIKGNYMITEIKLSQISEVIPDVKNEYFDHYWYIGKVKTIFIDETTGREKKSIINLLVETESVNEAYALLWNYIEEFIFLRTEIISVSLSQFVDIIE